VTRCSDCGAEVPQDDPGAERRPCPNCGSLARIHEKNLTANVTVTDSVETVVERGVNEARMTGFSVIFAAGLGVGLAVGFAAGPLLRSCQRRRGRCCHGAAPRGDLPRSSCAPVRDGADAPDHRAVARGRPVVWATIGPRRLTSGTAERAANPLGESDGRGWDRTSDLPRVKRALSR
jgi:hypothetical protein